MTDSTTQDDIEFATNKGLAQIHLNRPRALNALTLDTVRAMDPTLRQWIDDPAVHAVFVDGAGDKAFCAGGDIRMMWQANRDGDVSALQAFFGEEYRLNRLIHTYPKPYVSFLDGITMGGGVGISVHGSHRVATERTMFAMPETGIGMFPDVGGTYFLPRLPGKIGMYLGLTGARLGADDCYALGIATHVIPSERRDEVIKALEVAEEEQTSISDAFTAVTCILDMYHEDPGPGSLAPLRAQIDSLFNQTSVEDIVDALKADGSDWALKQVDLLSRKSPFALKVTFRQLQLGAQLDFDRCMQIEWRVAQRIAMTADFAEGVRATIVDKDNAPKWAANSLSDVDQADVDALFAPLDVADLDVD